MEIMEAIGLALLMGTMTAIAGPAVAVVMQWVSRWWLNPNHASKEEYSVFFNREYLGRGGQGGKSEKSIPSSPQYGAQA